MEATLFTDLTEGKVHSTYPQSTEPTLPRPTGHGGRRAVLCVSVQVQAALVSRGQHGQEDSLLKLWHKLLCCKNSSVVLAGGSCVLW